MAVSGQTLSGHILVADDDGGVRALLSSVLTGEGYSVSAVGNGRDALAEARRLRPQLILLNLRMPVLDGRQFAVRYREEAGPHAPILLVSGAADVADEVAATGAVDYLAKPFDVERLLARIQRLIPPTFSETKGDQRSEEDGLSRAGSAMTAATPLRTDARRRSLQRLRTMVEELRAQLQAVSEETTRLMAAERDRRLTRTETRRISALRMESERLRLELVQCRREFEALN